MSEPRDAEEALSEFRRRLVAFDTETHLIQPGLLAPPLVCGSRAWLGDDGVRAEFLDKQRARGEFARLGKSDAIVAGVSFAYDVGVCLQDAHDLAPAYAAVITREWFAKYDRDEVFECTAAQALDAIARGCLFKDPRTDGPLTDPETGRRSGRYSLSIMADLCLGRRDAKKNDFWRLRYGVLEHVPLKDWPEEATVYPADDARNTWEIASHQAEHLFNLHNQPDQARAALALHLACAHGFRTDGAAVAELKRCVLLSRSRTAQRFRDLGFLTESEDPDEADKAPKGPVKKRMAQAYGARGACPVCYGTGKVTSAISGNAVICNAKNAPPPHDGLEDWMPCDGTGLDLREAPMLSRTEKGAVQAGRDHLAESGDDDLEAFAEYLEDAKLTSTYIPFLETGTTVPLNPRANVLVASGRTSYDGIMQTMPRGSLHWCDACEAFVGEKHEHATREMGVRLCYTPREGFYYASSDYSSGELCTLAQVCLWSVGFSRMAEVINATKDPGALHAAFGARMAGMDVAAFKAALKAGDKRCKDYRQAAKAANFGFPGGMGAAKLVLAKRKKAEGSTTGPDGRKYAGIRFCILLGGAQACGVEMVTEWKKRPSPPVCRACCVQAEELKAAYLGQWEEMGPYFEFISTNTEASGRLTQYVSERVRGGVGFCDGANTLFQGLLADGAKRALWYVTREMHARPDSVLYGSRACAFFHDEVFSEVPIDVAGPAAIRQSELMVQGLKEYVPDVHVACEPTIMRRWYKAAEPRWVDGPSGRELVLWEPGS